MEDSHICHVLSSDIELYGVFDGHCGDSASKLCSEMMKEVLTETEEFMNAQYKDAFVKAFVRMDELVVENGITSAGTAAICVLLTKDKIIVANAGDSRAILKRSGQEAEALSFDHKPNNPEEFKRIKAGGGFVSEGRVNGSLALSRAIGDMPFKVSDCEPANQVVTCVPEVHEYERDGSELFLYIACDGIWDCDDIHSISNFLCRNIHEYKTVNEALFEKYISASSLSEPGGDNMTAILVGFLNDLTEEAWIERVQRQINS